MLKQRHPATMPRPAWSCSGLTHDTVFAVRVSQGVWNWHRKLRWHDMAGECQVRLERGLWVALLNGEAQVEGGRRRSERGEGVKH